jgi:ketosteroid isomerase-like protein
MSIMDNNVAIINKFYTAFKKLDADTMCSCYSADIVFFDPIFELLKGSEATYMWQMLCKNAKDFSLTYDNIQSLGDDYYTCEWVATYTFSSTGNKVVNKIKANMKVIDGIIIEHSDAFSVHKWSSQALGFVGKLFGWNSFFQRKIKNKAKRNLMQYIAANSQL